MSMETVMLKAFRLAVASHVADPEAFRTDAHWDTMARKMVLRMERMVMSEEMEDIEYRWPADWWEAIKDRWFPAWLKGRYPVRFERRGHSVKALYPNVAVPKWSPVLKIFKHSGPGFWPPSDEFYED